MPIRLRPVLRLSAVALLVLPAACARIVEPPAGTGQSPSPAPMTQVRLPPEAEGLPDRVLFGVANLPLPLVLSGTTAYIATLTSLLAVDVRSGQTLATVAPAHPLGPGPRGPAWNPAAPPILVKGTVVVPLLAEGPAVELIQVEAATGRRLASATIAIDAVPQPPTVDKQWLAVAGVAGTVAVLRVNGTTYGVDLARGTTVWREPGFTAAALAGDVIVGWYTEAGAAQRAAGLRAADGARLWTDKTAGRGLSAVTGGPQLAVLQGRADGRYLRVVQAATGRPQPLPANVTAAVAKASTVDGDAFACRYDGASTTVCGAMWDDWNAAFDATTGRWLWEVRAVTKGRTPIRLTAAWHGLVYGTENGTRPVVLDARTGAVRASAAVAAPYVVDAAAGVGPPIQGDGMYAFSISVQ
ncbi:PQQ-binding-like beta-propeller repeat protein [Dactylosporangium vinaceum]|uniref:Pyrroloquinoline-quinone binding quinoprotein n=1 Tax=Dactylosporangium vinaceum TaxID=53362 RepID=A0ABV5MD27_9ACTN|nr:hypothetical protein [Dactylosporangium vinaceum]UAC00814.1 PQQ-binding-like beta-propeller repeat protein [Dactylosporangium vinaceum]